MEASNDMQSIAELVVTLIFQTAEIPVRLVSEEADTDINALEAIRIETIALLLRMTEEIAQRSLSSAADFMLLIFERVIGEIANSANAGSDPLEALIDRFDYYGTLLVWIAPAHESPKGTLLWMYSERITQIANRKSNAAFSVGLSSLLMESFRRWDLVTLFSELDIWVSNHDGQ